MGECNLAAAACLSAMKQCSWTCNGKSIGCIYGARMGEASWSESANLISRVPGRRNPSGSQDLQDLATPSQANPPISSPQHRNEGGLWGDAPQKPRGQWLAERFTEISRNNVSGRVPDQMYCIWVYPADAPKANPKSAVQGWPPNQAEASPHHLYPPPSQAGANLDTRR